MPAEQSLSKEEISELSEALSTVREAGASQVRRGGVRAYDFEHPDKLSRMNMRALQLIFAGLERPWAATASSGLRTEVVVQVGSPEQSTFGAYAESFPAACVAAAVRMDPLPGVSFIDMPASLALRIVDRLIGAKGEGLAEARELTPIELSILKRFLNRLCADFSRAWSPVASVQFGVSDLYQSAGDIEVDEEELVIVAASTWAVASEEYRVNVAVPVSSLDKVLDVLDPQRWVRSEYDQSKTNPQLVAELLDPVHVMLSVELGRARVNMRGLANMEVGDVIKLDRTVNDPLEVKIGGRHKFYGRAGLVGKRLSIEIQEQVGATREPVVAPPSPAPDTIQG